MSHKATNWLSDVPADKLGNSEFRVLFHLCDCHNPSQGCFPTQAYLLRATGVSNGTLNAALRALEDKALIRRFRSVDEVTRRQLPTRYILGFEIDDPQGPSPETGDGTAPEPSPENGDGAVSRKRTDPSPENTPSRLQPTGDKPVKEPVINPAGGSDAAEFWAGVIRRGGFVAPNAVSVTLAQDMLRRELISEQQLRERSIAF